MRADLSVEGGVPRARPQLIGIAGPSCAGKSELARRLAAVIEAPIVSLDSYYRDLLHLSFEEPARSNFDEPDALDDELLTQHLRRLAVGAEVEVPVYDFTRHIRSADSVRVRAGAFGIVEGLFTLYWEPVRRLFGARVFVTAPDDVCLARRLERDVRERGRTRQSVLDQYEKTVRPMANRYILPQREHADIVINGTAQIEESVAACLRLL